MAGSGGGWEIDASYVDGPVPLSSVAKFAGQLFIGGNGLGLLKRTESGKLEVFKDNVPTVHMEARATLIITMENAMAGSADGTAFQGAAFDKLAELTAHRPLAGLSR